MGRFWAPKTILNVRRVWKDRPLEVDLFSACYLDHILVSSKTAQEAPKRPQDPPKTPPDPPKSALRGSKGPPRVPQEAPRRFQETPRAGQEGKFCFEILIFWHVIILNVLSPYCMSGKQENSKNAQLRCRATQWRTGMPKDGGRAAVSPQRGRQ